MNGVPPESFRTQLERGFPKLLVTAWCLWVLLRIIRVVPNPVWTSPTSTNVKAVWLGSLLIPVLGCWLAAQLYREPRRGLTLWFAAVCLIVLWKFWIANIVFLMHPIMGGYSLGGACEEWWHRSTSGVLPFLDSIPPVILAIVSAAYWLRRCFGGK
jgi:hypothetical protein